MKEYLNTMVEELNDTTNEQHTIRVGRYQGKALIDDKFQEINGELFITVNNAHKFMVISDDSSMAWKFNTLSYDAIVTPIKDLKEDIPIPYDELDVSNKASLRRFFPNDEIGIEMFECTQSVPVRFRKDALEVFCDAENREMWTLGTVDKAWTYFLMEIIEEMTEEEKKIYGF